MSTAKNRYNGLDVKTQMELLMFPEDLVSDLSKNGRWTGSAASRKEWEKSVALKIDSIKEHGQKTPIAVRKVGDKYEVSVGYTRHAAMIKINEERKANGEEPLRIRCELTSRTEKEAFIDNIIENFERNELTAIDHAYNHERMRKELEMTDTQIAAFYKKTPAWVSQHKQLLSLDKATQDKVHAGLLAASVAFTLSDMSEDQRKDIIAKATNETTGKVRSAVVKENVRTARAESGSTQNTARSVKEIRNAFTAIAEEEDVEPNLKRFAKDMIKFVNGKISDKALHNTLLRFQKSEVAELEEATA